MEIGENKKDLRGGDFIQPKQKYQEDIKISGDVNSKKCIKTVFLLITIMTLGLFFFYISTTLNSKALSGLGIMSGALIMGIFIEIALIKKRRFPIDETLLRYKRQLITDYKTRKLIHFTVTPMLLITYIYGFIMLLSILEQEQWGEFYLWIIYFSCIVFSGLATLIGLQLRKELEILKLLAKYDQVP